MPLTKTFWLPTPLSVCNKLKCYKRHSRRKSLVYFSTVFPVSVRIGDFDPTYFVGPAKSMLARSKM